jgi:redox-sensitive bicupin YhaK (pirin superfamily)
MINLRENQGRQHESKGKREVWRTFYPQDDSETLVDGFGSIELIDEERLPPGADVAPSSFHDGEVITYVHSGALEYEDSLRRSGVILAGEFQRMCHVRDNRYGEKNASQTEWARIFRIQLRFAKAEGEAGYDQKRFSAAERRGRLCLVASPDGRCGSLRIRQDTRMYSTLLLHGQHVVHELSPRRSAWLHVVHGEVAFGDVVLTAGDGAGFTAERSVSLMARKGEEASVLLFDVSERKPSFAEARGAELELGETQGSANLTRPRARGNLPGSGPSSGDGEARHSGAALFGMLWEALVDVLGSATAATLVGRAARRAQPRCPDLDEFAVVRIDQQYACSVPHSFDQTAGPPEALRALLNEIRPLLTQMTGQVVLRHLDQRPELRGWATLSP